MDSNCSLHLYVGKFHAALEGGQIAPSLRTALLVLKSEVIPSIVADAHTKEHIENVKSVRL